MLKRIIKIGNYEKGNKSETTTLRQMADELIIAREEKAGLATENYQYLLKYNRF